jgi:tetratricopeptide (TPR) repeat protein
MGWLVKRWSSAPSGTSQRVLLLVVALALLALDWRSLVAAGLTNRALLRALDAGACDSGWRPDVPGAVSYPPQKCQGTSRAIEQAVAWLERAVRYAPASMSVVEHLADLQYADGRDDEAAGLLARLVMAGNPRHAVLSEGQVPYHFLKSRLLEQHGDLDGAQGEIRRGLQLGDFRLGPHRERLALQGLSALAGRQADTSVDSPQAADAAYRAIVAAACAADWETAWARAGRVSAQISHWPHNQRQVAERLMAFRARQANDAATEGEWLLRAGPVPWNQWTIGDPYLGLGQTLEATGLHFCTPGPLSIYSWYSAGHPASGQGDYLQASVDYWRGDLTAAEAAALSGYRREPGHGGCRILLAFIYENEGKLDSAVLWYRRALDVNAASAEIRARLARVYHLQGRDQEASLQFERAMSLESSNPRVLVLAGLFFAETGRPGRARELLDRALQADPGNIDARRKLEQLGSGVPLGTRR